MDLLNTRATMDFNTVVGCCGAGRGRDLEAGKGVRNTAALFITVN